MAIIKDQIARMKGSRPLQGTSHEVTRRIKSAREATAEIRVPTEEMSKAKAEQYRRHFDAARNFEDEDDGWLHVDTNTARPSHVTHHSLTSPRQSSPHSNSHSKVSTLRSTANIFSPQSNPNENTHVSSPLASRSQLKPTAPKWVSQSQNASPTGHSPFTAPTANAPSFVPGTYSTAKGGYQANDEEEGPPRLRDAVARERELIGQQLRDRALARARRTAMQEEESERHRMKAGRGEGDYYSSGSPRRMDEKIPWGVVAHPTGQRPWRRNRNFRVRGRGSFGRSVD
ncbi:hypothetical protein M409DRAFT_23320 [Zasmidium cellare ATCC 36951]|uniref:Uncharacterized protein n=1 Tax=Zasmidium cellare ATCC 36951 TaxID=1080233 RepID=A0A6A6CI41_ZASCE|nr:uncharacterized protein M409DRAFT_23320 [Zasmidium cellare ATCC 36951]KAF2166691.1 hypothetical protein M409DRAFT_23320 [Zasmidium cellare ATCC 36951]